MFDTRDQNLERDLALLKNSINPSSDLARHIARVTQSEAPRYHWYYMLQRKFIFMIPAAVALIIAIVLIGGKDQGSTPFPPSQVSYEDTSAEEIINGLVNDALAEQSIADESDADVALIDSDRAALDSFAGAYNANEY